MANTSPLFLPLFQILLTSFTCVQGSYSPPEPLKVLSLMEAYAPWVIFHPDEEFFPSSIEWFFRNGAALHQTGKNPQPVTDNGDNLPDGVGPDDAYLDLPSDQSNMERVKKGSLGDAVGYVHAKPALGGTATDLAIWLYYPFNGGSKFQFGPFTISLSKIGEHVSDWEHITLRVDNVMGKLQSVYLSQHAKGKWFKPEEFQLRNGRPVIYSSLHGHAHYNTASSHVHFVAEIQNQNNSKSVNQSNNIFKLGVKDETGLSTNLIDLASEFDITYIDYFDTEMQPWLKYQGRWGPKINYTFTEEVTKIANAVPGPLKKLLIKAFEKLPAELRGEEGPQGPKMRDSWSGDEPV